MWNLPEFLIVGAAKSGTTSLYSWLRQHPEIYMPVYKEPNFLSDLLPSGKAIRTLSEYQALFEKGYWKATANQVSAITLHVRTIRI
jgi:hypothetical protein